MNIPGPVVKRLPVYLIQVQSMMLEGRTWISSRDLAGALGLTGSTVRQDLSYLPLTGISKRGYEAVRLEQALIGMLTGSGDTRVIIVGAGHLGCALALNKEFASRGFSVCAVFDRDRRLLNRKVGPFPIQPMSQLKQAVRTLKASIGIIAVPASSSQDVADQLIRAGISGLLNLACAHINSPKAVPVVHARISTSLQELRCMMSHMEEQ